MSDSNILAAIAELRAEIAGLRQDAVQRQIHRLQNDVKSLRSEA